MSMKQTNGMDVSVKHSKRPTHGWRYFTFGHHAEPCALTAAESPENECAFCHEQYVVKT